MTEMLKIYVAGPMTGLNAIHEKQRRNEARTWPDWRGADPDKAIEHVRTGEVPA